MLVLLAIAMENESLSNLYNLLGMFIMFLLIELNYILLGMLIINVILILYWWKGYVSVKFDGVIVSSADDGWGLFRCIFCVKLAILMICAIYQHFCCVL